MKSRVLACIFFLLSWLLPADSVWEGSAAVSRYGEFPDTGFYGASNSFSRNTTVNVENLENGRQIRLIITGRVSDPSIFLLVSKEAASALGIPAGEIVRTRVTVAKETAYESYVRPNDLQTNPDPDINPSMIAKNILKEEKAIQPEVKEPVQAKLATEETPKTSTVVEPKVVEEKPLYESLGRIVQTEKALSDYVVLPDIPKAVKDVPQVETLHAVPEKQKSMVVDIFIPEEPAEKDLEVQYDEMKGGAPRERRLVLTERVELPLEPQAERPNFSLLSPRYAKNQTRPNFTGPYDIPEAPLVYFDAPVMVAMDAQAEVEEFSVSPEGIEIPSLPETSLATEQKPLADDAARVEGLLSGSASDFLRTPNILSLQLPEEPVKDSGLPSYALFDTVSPDSRGAEVAFAEMALPQVPDKPFAYPEVLAEGPRGGEERIPEFGEIQLPETSEKTEKLTEEVKHPEVTSEIQPEVPVDVKPSGKTTGVSTTPLVETSVPDVDVILVPADKRPPVVTEKTTEEPKIKPEEKKPDEEKPIVRVVEEPPAGKEAGGTVKEEVKETARKEEGQALPFTPTLLKGSYYLQLGAFSEEAKARRLAAQFTSTYPMTIQVAESGAKKTYKVLIGPLKPDESGALLFTLKASGYKDAFVVKN